MFVAKSPMAEGHKAFLTYTSVTTARADEPLVTVTVKEGYTVAAAGEVVDYFMETFGQTYS